MTEEKKEPVEIKAEDRYSRQSDLVALAKLKDRTVTVIGVGAIGRQVALQLTAMGVPKVQLIDFDTVDVPNLGAQGFLEADLGDPKVDAVAKMCKQINGTTEVVAENGRYAKEQDIGNYIFVCVDKMDARNFIWEDLKKRGTEWEFIVDGRMSAENMRIVSVSDDATSKRYKKLIFPQEEAFEGRCTAKTTIYCSNVVAGIMVSQFAKHIRGVKPEFDVQYNLLTNEITVQD